MNTFKISRAIVILIALSACMARSALAASKSYSEPLALLSQTKIIDALKDVVSCKTLECYKEYNSTVVYDQDQPLWVLCLKNCREILIEQVGDMRWFFMSAMSGNKFTAGSSLEILDNKITNVYVVRARVNNNYQIQIYFGCGFCYHNTESTIKSPVFQAKLLSVQWKNTKTIKRDYVGTSLVTHLSARTITKKADYLQKSKEEVFCTMKDSYLHDGCLYSKKCFWN